MMHLTYLFIDFFTLIIPLLFSFHPKLNFYRTWPAFFPAVILVALLFLIWDEWFTRLGVWGFNDQYVTGVKIGRLPLEELLFFICIPYACVFTFHCLTMFGWGKMNTRIENIVTVLLVTGLAGSGVIFIDRTYTSVTFLSLAILLLLVKYRFKIKWLGRFYSIYAVLLLPFIIVNGILTGMGLEKPVVWYNNNEILGIRLLTIPLEDIFYGMELILLNLIIYQRLLERKSVASLKKLRHAQDL